MDIDEYRLDDPEVLGDPDAASMLRSVAGAGAQVREAAALAAEAGLHTLAEDGRPRALVVAGVGTAARTGDVLAAVAGSGCPVPVLSHRSAIVPGGVGAADMVIAVSASGKSPEALAAAEAAMQRGARLVAVGAADSPLQSMAERARAIFVPVPPRRPARVSFWALVVPVLLAGRAVGLANVTEADFAETAKRLDDDAERCRPVGEVFVNSGKALAVELAGSIPVVWGTNRLSSVAASRFADSLAANARYPAIAGALVEAGRGRVGLLDGPFGSMAGGSDDFFADRSDDSKDTRLRLVLLRDDDEAPIAARRAEAVADLAAARGVGVSVLTAEGGCELERLASLIAIPDFASVYLALLHGIDPIAVPAVTDLKERIAP
ncbi:MAG: glucose/mannose-6-phosphate isomerase [Cryptosporangiaceae bacterium]|nr:glucose/mannose-6-phosphate isomerase [Cryptosporangiaceae bacterium]